MWTVTRNITSSTQYNHKAVVGSNVTFSCNKTQHVRWNYYHGRSTTAVRLYVSGQVHSNYSERFEVKFDAETGRSNLIVRNVKREDSGTYVCLELNDNGVTFNLTVIGKSVYCVGTNQWRRKYFRKEGAEKIRREAPKKVFIAPLGNFAGGADFRVGLVYWQWHLTK